MAYGSLKTLRSTSYRKSGVNKLYNTNAYRQRSSTGSYVKSTASLVNIGKARSSTLDAGTATIPGTVTTTEVQPLNEHIHRDYLQEIVYDETPQLGGNLDVNGKRIGSPAGAGNHIYIQAGQNYWTMPTNSGSRVVVGSGNDQPILGGYYFPIQSADNQQKYLMQSITASGLTQLSWVTKESITDGVGGGSGGIDYGTFNVDTEGNLIVEYLGGEYTNAFTINNNGEMEVEI